MDGGPRRRGDPSRRVRWPGPRARGPFPGASGRRPAGDVVALAQRQRHERGHHPRSRGDGPNRSERLLPLQLRRPVADRRHPLFAAPLAGLVLARRPRSGAPGPPIRRTQLRRFFRGRRSVDHTGNFDEGIDVVGHRSGRSIGGRPSAAGSGHPRGILWRYRGHCASRSRRRPAPARARRGLRRRCAPSTRRARGHGGDVPSPDGPAPRGFLLRRSRRCSLTGGPQLRTSCLGIGHPVVALRRRRRRNVPAAGGVHRQLGFSGGRLDHGGRSGDDGPGVPRRLDRDGAHAGGRTGDERRRGRALRAGEGRPAAQPRTRRRVPSSPCVSRTFVRTVRAPGVHRPRRGGRGHLRPNGVQRPAALDGAVRPLARPPDRVHQQRPIRRAGYRGGPRAGMRQTRRRGRSSAFSGTGGAFWPINSGRTSSPRLRSLPANVA